MFYNEFEIEVALDRWAGDPVLGPATQTLTNLVEWTNNHSDGWPYWQKPHRAAAKLAALIFEAAYTGPTAAQLRAAYTPLKAFRTRHHAEFEIVEVP